MSFFFVSTSSEHHTSSNDVFSNFERILVNCGSEEAVVFGELAAGVRAM